MLVLSRKESQRIRLGDSIVVTIVKISGDKVRVGIEAPTNVLVLRDELEAHAPAPPATAGEEAAKRADDEICPLQRSA
jgi:carbon storage regulator